jgi:hypothetical protein
MIDRLRRSAIESQIGFVLVASTFLVAGSGLVARLCGVAVGEYAGAATGVMLALAGAGLVLVYAGAASDRRRFHLIADDQVMIALPCVGTCMAVAGAAFISVAAIAWLGGVVERADRTGGAIGQVGDRDASAVAFAVAVAICLPLVLGVGWANAAAASLHRRFESYYRRVADMHLGDEGVGDGEAAERIHPNTYVAQAADGSLFSIGPDEF